MGLDFVDAPRVFDGPTYTYEDDRFDYSEQRFVTLGILDEFVNFGVEVRRRQRIGNKGSVPKGQTRIARRFNAGIRRTSAQVPKGRLNLRPTPIVRGRKT